MDGVPIETARQNVSKLGIKYDELPQLPSWATMMGVGKTFQADIAREVLSRSVAVGRQLSQPETDALAQHFAVVLNTGTMVSPVTYVSALALHQRTHAQYGFPFWTPKPEKFDPTKVWGVPIRPAALGYYFWHGLRLASWFTACKLASSIFLASYALSVYEAKFSTDPRLADYRRDLAAKYRLESQGQTRRQQHSRSNLPASEESSHSWPNTEQTPDQDPQDSQTPWPVMQSPQPETAETFSKSDEPYEFDDAAPVERTEQRRDATQQSSQGGSAWDRLRKQQSTTAAKSQGTTQQTSAWSRKREEELKSRGAQEESSFSYSSSAEEKSYAKEQAQQDFDDMLERERRGATSGRR